MFDYPIKALRKPPATHDRLLQTLLAPLRAPAIRNRFLKYPLNAHRRPPPPQDGSHRPPTPVLNVLPSTIDSSATTAPAIGTAQLVVQEECLRQELDNATD